jgi:O-antigen ligase
VVSFTANACRAEPALKLILPRYGLRDSRNLSQTSTFLEKTIIAGLMLAVVFTALAFGTVEVWAVAIFAALVLALVALWSVKAVLDKRLVIKIPTLAVPFAALVVCGIVQSLQITRGGESSSLSLDAEATRAAATMLFLLFVSFIVASNFLVSHNTLKLLATFLIVYGLAMAVFAIVQHLTWSGRLYWVRPVTVGGAGYGGPFVNRNHFAGYMEMLIPISVALALTRAVGRELRLFCGFSAAMMGIAEIASLSRGGIISLTGALLFISAMAPWIRKSMPRGMAIGFRREQLDEREPKKLWGSIRSLVFSPVLSILLIAFAIIAGVFWVDAGGGLATRVANDSLTGGGPTSRWGIWSDTVSMIQAHPVLGVGLGAYKTAYPLFGRGDGSLLVDYTHNDYLQLIADCGIVGGAIALVFLVVLFRSVRRCVDATNPVSRAVSLGCAGGLFAMLIHSLFDFNLQVPSNALLFLILLSVVSEVGSASAGGEFGREWSRTVARPAL